MWLKLFGSVVVLVGVILIYDGRRIVKKYFDYGEENTATTGIKILGFIITLVGGWMMI